MEFFGIQQRTGLAVRIIAVLMTVALTVVQVYAHAFVPDSSRHPGVPAEKLRLQKEVRDNPEDMETWIKLSLWCAENSYADDAVTAGKKAIALSAAGTPGRLAALTCTGQAYVAARDYDSARIYLSDGESLYRTLSSRLSDKDMVTVYTLYNSLAIYTINSELNYNKAIEYFTKAVDAASVYSEGKDYEVILDNLIICFFVRGDSDGLEYAQDAYDKGMEQGNMSIQYRGAMGLAMMYFLREDYEEALEYIDIALDNPNSMRAISWVYTIKANILGALGDRKEAGLYYRMAQENIDTGTPTTLSYMWLSVGNFRLGGSDTEGAIKAYDTGLEYALEANDRIFLFRIYKALSDAYAQKKDYSQAYRYYVLYDEEAERIFSIESERAISDLKIQNETLQHKAEIQRMDYKMRVYKYVIIFGTTILVILAIAVATVTLMYRQKNKLYLKIAKQYNDAIRKEKTDAAGQVSAAEHENVHGDGARASEKLMFSKLEDMMKNDMLYKDPLLSREKLAELAGISKTVLSSLIKEFSGKSVSAYINGYRIKHALNILSNPDSEMAIKEVESESGFYSSSTFFRVFKEEVGMPPVTFRQKISMLNNKS